MAFLIVPWVRLNVNQSTVTMISSHCLYIFLSDTPQLIPNTLHVDMSYLQVFWYDVGGVIFTPLFQVQTQTAD